MGQESFDMVGFDLGSLFQGQTMVHWLWRVVFSVDTNLHRFSDAFMTLFLFVCKYTSYPHMWVEYFLN